MKMREVNSRRYKEKHRESNASLNIDEARSPSDNRPSLGSKIERVRLAVKADSARVVT
jgi:hypothetical protein